MLQFGALRYFLVRMRAVKYGVLESAAYLLHSFFALFWFFLSLFLGLRYARVQACAS